MKILALQNGNYPRTKPYIAEYVCRSTGIRSSHLRLYPEQFLRIPLVCPSLKEQESILTAISDATAQLEIGIRNTYREIELLREYRTRLITDVVTGKLDMREAAANLPQEEEAEEPEAIEEFDEITEEQSEENGSESELQ